jgi:hypothetical protein
VEWSQRRAYLLKRALFRHAAPQTLSSSRFGDIRDPV